MAMDHGASVDQGSQMGADAISAALRTIDQIRFVGLTSKVGIPAMFGVNDISSEVSTLADAHDLLNFAKGNSDITRHRTPAASRNQPIISPLSSRASETPQPPCRMRW
jgi:hypothetical protein